MRERLLLRYHTRKGDPDVNAAPHAFHRWVVELKKALLVNHAVILVLFCLSELLICTGCGRDKNCFERRIVYPLVAYRSEVEERVRTSGKPSPQWIELSNGKQRAITGNDDYELWVLVDDLENIELTGTLGLQSTPGSRNVPRVTFRLLVSGVDGSQRVVLAEYVKGEADRGWETFRQPVERTINGPGYVGLQVVYRDGIPPREHPLAVWIEPTVERTVVDTIRCSREAPNVLLITADTTRQDDLECYGGRAATPALNALADDGILFSSAYSVAFGTTPSHASLLAARYAAEHGVYTNRAILREDNTTLPEVLRAQGYVTAAFVSAVPVARSLGLAQGFDLFDDAFITDNSRREFSLTTRERRADVTVGLFLEWLRNRSNKGLPFFVWIHLFDPHQPYAPSPGVQEQPDAAPDVQAILGSYFANPDGSPKILGQTVRSHLGRSLLLKLNRIARARYRDEISFMDRQIGRAVDALKAMDLYQRTLIVFVSDHGENFLDRGRHLAFTHRGLYGDVSLLPFIMKLPLGNMAGRDEGFLLGNLDIAPTILDIVGTGQPPGWSGRSFLPVLQVREEPEAFRHHLVIESAEERELGIKTARWSYRELIDPRKTPRLIASRLGYKRGQSAQLHDLGADPAERANLIGSGAPVVPTTSSFHDIAEAFLSKKTDTTATSMSSPQHMEALRALGYVE